MWNIFVQEQGRNAFGLGQCGQLWVGSSRDQPQVTSRGGESGLS